MSKVISYKLNNLVASHRARPTLILWMMGQTTSLIQGTGFTTKPPSRIATLVQNTNPALN
jgi:hypothetical protein